MRVAFLISATILLAVLPAFSSPSAHAQSNAERFFETRIRPVLIDRCFKCHGGDKVSQGLRVDSRAALLKGGEGGAALVPKDPAKSLIFKAIDPAFEDLQMPPDDPLPPKVLADFRRWITEGAAWPKSFGKADIQFQAKRHWAFEPLSRPPIPAPDQNASANPVDRFVHMRLEAAGLGPSAAADRATLIRRLKFDLLGLPSTFQEVRAFESDSRPDAWERLVDQYLASPQYGERWGRHWLDVARYADTKGYVFREDRNYPFAYTYRDWVVRSLNEDLPYDAFLLRQMAADRLVAEGLERSELPALGFLTIGRRYLNNIHDITDDRIDVVTRGTMALTVTCARCHDHKYDPIPMADYYSLYGVFRSSSEPKDLPGAMVLVEGAKPFNPRILVRGQPGNPGAPVPRQFLEVVAGPDRRPFQQGGGRLEMARAIADAGNPLTPRVIVNRIWRQHFHSPLVNTPSDFGLRCDPPTHPQLLDWLASYLIDNDWSLKALHRVLLTSETYRQTSRDDPARRAIDPENRLSWRMNRARLELEPMRDAILSVAGGLDAAIGGKSVSLSDFPPVRRRTIYGFIDRQNLPSLFRTFDFAGPDTHSPGRIETTVPQQTLYLRNSRFLTHESARIAARLPDSSTERRIEKLFQRVLGRNPRGDEQDVALKFIHQTKAQPDAVTGSVWSYGYGEFDARASRLKSFSHFPHFTGKSWQGGGKLPDPTLGWASLRGDSGHPGDSRHSTVLRWTAPRAARIRVAGQLVNPTRQGDGVRATVVTNDRKTGDWVASNARTETRSDPASVQAGDTVDLIVSCRADTSFDSYTWQVRIVDVENGTQWNAARQFHGPLPARLDAWGQLAQVLLMSNEFQFVD